MFCPDDPFALDRPPVALTEPEEQPHEPLLDPELAAVPHP